MRALDLKPTEEEWLEGPDVTEVQKALGFTGRDVDGIYGPDTAFAVQQWKWRFGFPRNHVNDRLGFQGRAWLLGLKPAPADFAQRVAERANTPMPGPNTRSGLVMPLPVSMGHGSEFRVEDEEGAPGPGGKNFHAAKDWFAPGGTPVRAPSRGTICEVKPSRGDTGQIFGGTVKIEQPDGRVWVFRHVIPRVAMSASVGPGDLVASVVAWKSGSSHVHIELWKTLAGGYNLSNMIDPVSVLR